MLFLSAGEQAVSNFEYWNFLLSGLNLLIAVFSAWCAYEANQRKNEIQKIENNINTNIHTAVETAVKNEVQNNVSATASVTNIINDEESIQRIASAVANELITKRSPKFIFKEGVLDIQLPDE